MNLGRPAHSGRRPLIEGGIGDDDSGGDVRSSVRRGRRAGDGDAGCDRGEVYTDGAGDKAAELRPVPTQALEEVK